VNLKLNIFKNKLSISKDNKDTKTSDPLSTKLDPKIDLALNSTVDPSVTEKVIPQFMTLSKLDFDKFDVRAGLIKDSTAKGGIRYQIIEPSLSERDSKALEIIKKLLMTELSVSMGEIKSKKEAEYRLGRKIEKMIKTYRLKIPAKNIAKIKYFAIRDFVHLGKIEPSYDRGN
jgi:flagellar protein FlaI